MVSAFTPPDQAVQVQALAKDIVLCYWPMRLSIIKLELTGRSADGHWMIAEACVFVPLL